MTARLGLRLAFGISISVAACLLLLQVVDLSATATRLGSISPAWLAVPLIALALQLTIRARRWALLVSASAGTPVRTRRTIGPLAVGYLVNAVLPARLGEVARGVIISRRERLTIGAVAASIIIERVVDLTALLSIGLLSTGAVATIGWSSVAATAALVFAVGVLIHVAPALAKRMPQRAPFRLREAAAHFLVGIGGVRPRFALIAFGLSVVAWMGDVAIVWACSQAIGVELALPAAVAIAVGAALGTALPAASGYLGTYELGAVALGSFAGTPADTILAIAVLTHVFAVVPTALLGLASMVRMGVRVELPTREHRAGGSESVGAEATAGRP